MSASASAAFATSPGNPGESGETILVVDDEEPVRRTFRDWLESANLGCRILTAGDAATALMRADEVAIDLAVLDWNLGAGHDGLQLLQDLTLFNPDVVAIMITGFANQATPLMALRMGVRDFLDKNQDLTRERFLAAVTKQLERIRPARRERRIHQQLVAFRSAVESVLPLVQTATALHDPVPLPGAIHALLAFLLQAASASDAALVVHSYDSAKEPADRLRAYDRHGAPQRGPFVPFARSIAGQVVSMQEPAVFGRLETLTADAGIELQPFERARKNLLAIPIVVATGTQVILELFDRPEGQAAERLSENDRRLASAAMELGGELLRQALAEHQTRSVLFDAVAAALRAGDAVTGSMEPTTPTNDTPPRAILEQVRAGLELSAPDGIDAETTLRLAEAIRRISQRHGERAVEHCTRQVEQLGRFLDELSGFPEEETR